MSDNFTVFKLKNSQFMKTFRRIGDQKPLLLHIKTLALSDGLIFSIDNQIVCDLFHKSFSLTARVVGLDFIFRGLGLCKCYGYQALKMLIGHPFITRKPSTRPLLNQPPSMGLAPFSFSPRSRREALTNVSFTSFGTMPDTTKAPYHEGPIPRRPRGQSVPVAQKLSHSSDLTAVLLPAPQSHREALGRHAQSRHPESALSNAKTLRQRNLELYATGASKTVAQLSRSSNR